MLECGIKKRILIFNTSNNLVHDPIAVADPEHFEWRINVDDETPYSGYLQQLLLCKLAPN